MNNRWHASARLIFTSAVVLALQAMPLAQAQLKVIISGGFNVPYRELLPEFEKTTGIIVTTTMGFSQGPGDTIAKQLARGVPADVVILAKEGLADIIADGKVAIAPGTSVDLAQTPVGVSVRAGAPKPDISTVDAFKEMLHRAKVVAIPPSTVGIYLSTRLYPQLGMAEEMARKTTTNNAALAKGDADIAIRAVSELLHVRDTDFVGTIPKEIQFISVFSAAVIATSKEPEAAKRLIAFLTSDKATAAIRNSGMEPSRTQLPAEGQKASSSTAKAKMGTFVVGRTPWGDPDLQGNFTNKSEQGTPFERPAEYEGRRVEEFQGAELAEILRQRQDRIIANARPEDGDPVHAPVWWSDRYDITKGGRPWFVVDPPDGHIPVMTAAGEKRIAARNAARARSGHGPADSYEDRSLYDQCISRGLPGSMMPAIYGDSYQILQGPGYVAIRYEMIHETRIIPLDARAHVSTAIREYMGDGRGHWEGNTLVVETTNFRENSTYRNANADTLRLVERFTRIAPHKVEWSVTVDDPSTWTRPWTFSIPLTADDSEPIFEYACHEGNYGLRNILSGARAEEKRAAEGAPNGIKHTSTPNFVFDHLSLNVADTRKATEWYTSHLGGTPDGDSAVRFGSVRLSFRQSATSKPSEGAVIDHLAFAVDTLPAGFSKDPWGTRIEIVHGKTADTLHHIHVLATSPEATMNWLVQSFGGERARVDGMDVVKFGAVLVAVERVDHEPEPTAGHVIDHMGWGTPNLDTAAAELTAAGVKFTTQPRVVGNLHVAFVEGPNQLRVEIVQR